MFMFAFIIQALAGYMCFRLYIAFNSVMSKGLSFFLVFICLVLGESFFLLMVSEFKFGVQIPRWVFLISFLCMVMSFYLVLLFAASDILRIIRLYPAFLKNYRFLEMLLLVFIAAMVVIYGYFNAHNIKMKEIDILTNKPGINFTVLFMSDLHLGSGAVTGESLAKAVDMANAKNPDIVILGGDIVDNYIRVIRTEGFDKTLMRLRAKHGVFAVLGNHEYYRNSIKTVIETYRDLEMVVLRDETLKNPALGITLTGLDDRTGGHLKSISKLLPADNTFKLLVSHNPIRQEEAIANQVDLFLGGHTHAGQLFPINLILKSMYKTVWGYDKFGNTQVYVSSGLGVWGPPVRVGSDAEMILLKVKSK